MKGRFWFENYLNKKILLKIKSKIAHYAFV